MFSNYKITWHFTQALCKANSIGKIKIQLDIFKSYVCVCLSPGSQVPSFITDSEFILKCLCLLFNQNHPPGYEISRDLLW